MNVPELVTQVRSGIVHIEFYTSSECIASGSGFITKNKLITNHHVFCGPKNSTVKISSQPTHDPLSRRELVKFSYNEFAQSLISGSDEACFDYAILDAPWVPQQDIYQFNIATETSNQIGDEVIILGFPFEHRNLVCHRGVISSFFDDKNVKIIQLDCSVNAGNSGGPLLDIQTGKIIGIVTRRFTGLTKMFDQLMSTFAQNALIFEEFKNYINISDFNPALALLVIQNQMHELANEIQRSANVGIGYAFSTAHILNDNALTD